MLDDSAHAEVAHELHRRSTAAAQLLPMDEAPHIASWARMLDEDEPTCGADILLDTIIELRAPIGPAVRASPAYQAATRSGAPLTRPSARDAFVDPDGLLLALHETAVGRVPVIRCRTRADFVRIVRSVVHQNAPVEIPTSMGACLVAGYVNWRRVRTALLEDGIWSDPLAPVSSTALKRLRTEPFRFRDTYVVLSEGSYSGVPASAMGLDASTWRALSTQLRLEHEAAHYVCRRALGEMRNALLDELAADYAAITISTGSFDATWLRRFMGVDQYPRFRAGGRLENYGRRDGRTTQGFAALQKMTLDASLSLEKFDLMRNAACTGNAHRLDIARAVVAIMQTGLEALCASNGQTVLFRRWCEQQVASSAPHEAMSLQR